jgi:hypothetical protein
MDCGKVTAMLELRPTCEHCNRALPPESPVDAAAHGKSAAPIKSIPPEKR